MSRSGRVRPASAATDQVSKLGKPCWPSAASDWARLVANVHRDRPSLQGRDGPIGARRLDLVLAAPSWRRLRGGLRQVCAIGGFDGGTRRQAEPGTAQHRLQRGQANEHILLAAVVAHRANTPDAPVQGPERGANLDAEVVEQGGAYLFAINTCRDVHAGDAHHLVPPVAKYLKSHGLE